MHKREKPAPEPALAYGLVGQPVVRLRGKNQLTIPHEIAERAGLEPGERFAIDLDPDEPDVIRLRRLRTSYAGLLRDMWGSHEDVLGYLREERASWGE